MTSFGPTETELLAKIITGRDRTGNIDLLNQVEKKLLESDSEVTRRRGQLELLTSQLASAEASLASAEDSRSMWAQMFELTSGRDALLRDNRTPAPLPRSTGPAPAASVAPARQETGSSSATATMAPPTRYSSTSEPYRVPLNLDKLPPMQQSVEKATQAASGAPVPIHGIKTPSEWPAAPQPTGRARRRKYQTRRPVEVSPEEFATWFNLVKQEFGEYPTNRVAGAYFNTSNSSASRVFLAAKQAGLLNTNKSHPGSRWERTGRGIKDINERFGTYK